MKYELMDMCSDDAVIKVIGVGGGGGNAVDHMVQSHIDGVQFICANTDAQALRRLNVDTRVQLGVELTKGLGAGTKPEVGKQAAEENRDHIKEVIDGADMVFLTAGMGGGTGTGAISVIAEIAREMSILTVAVVTKPFDFEGKKKKIVADAGISELEKNVDSLIIIPNQKLLPVLGSNLSLINAFKAANDVLLDAVQGITELITHPGLINVDFADVKTVMSNMGPAIMGSGSASGDNRAREAAEKAIACPLLEDIDLQGAHGILVNITAKDMDLTEFDEIGSIMHAFASEEADMKIGTAINPDMGDEIKVTVVATGMGKSVSHTSTNNIVKKAATGDINYDVLDKPTVIRHNKKEQPREARFGAQPKQDMNLDYLDVPAFLRRQAD
ncbi:MAG: cell division protein FtsZ [Methylococcales symbiont of Hymedesmia sp. n. MRB-2018]|nr:MAG: cell division protein FtsZ [Methylococcales symbiont of Hymedesmia sp. n. MRB-2018]KAF3983750.1 MAG: cell division protein FtsZ [Methylococcales symbiont of Hymedesmia sp. n. MRB-2018]